MNKMSMGERIEANILFEERGSLFSSKYSSLNQRNHEDLAIAWEHVPRLTLRKGLDYGTIMELTPLPNR